MAPTAWHLRAEHWGTVAVTMCTHWTSMHVVVMVSAMARMSHMRLRHSIHHITTHCIWRSHSFLFLSPVAEPNSHHFFLQLQRVGQRSYFLSRRFWLLVKMLLECSFDRHFDASALFSLSALCGNLVNTCR